MLKKSLLALTAVAMLSGGGIVSANDTAILLIVENDNYIGIESRALRPIVRATALLASPGGAALANLPAGTLVQIRGQSGAFVNVQVQSGSQAGRIGWISTAAL